MANVLIVDDEMLIPPMLGDYLGRFGHTVKIARSALGALGWLDVEQFEVVVMDVMMPGPMDGLDVCRRIRSDARTIGLKVLIISGVPDMGKKAYAAGADAFLPKPFDLADVLGVVSRLSACARPMAIHPGATVRDAIKAYPTH